MEDIEYYSIPVYNFPYDFEEDDEETIQDNSELRVSITTHSSACRSEAESPVREFHRPCSLSLSSVPKKKS